MSVGEEIHNAAATPESGPKKFTINSSSGGGVLLRLVMDEKVVSTGRLEVGAVVKQEVEEVEPQPVIDMDEEMDWNRVVKDPTPSTYQGRNQKLEMLSFVDDDKTIVEGSYHPDYDWESRMTMTEDGQRAFQCEFCDHFTVYKTNLQEHMVWRHGQRSKFRCNVCYKYFPNSKAKSFREHLETCTTEPLAPEDLEMLKTLPCPYCKRKYRTLTYLNVHIKHVHIRLRHIHCPHCSFRTGKNAALTRHLIRIHGYKGDLKCNICTKQFHKSLVKAFRHHVLACKRAELNNMFICTECGHKFGVRDRLTAHIKKAHHPRPMFPCEHCNLSFRSGTLLRNHLIRKHDYETDTQCPKCEREFPTFEVERFERHILRCNGEWHTSDDEAIVKMEAVVMENDEDMSMARKLLGEGKIEDYTNKIPGDSTIQEDNNKVPEDSKVLEGSKVAESSTTAEEHA